MASNQEIMSAIIELGSKLDSHGNRLTAIEAYHKAEGDMRQSGRDWTAIIIAACAFLSPYVPVIFNTIKR